MDRKVIKHLGIKMTNTTKNISISISQYYTLTHILEHGIEILQIALDCADTKEKSDLYNYELQISSDLLSMIEDAPWSTDEIEQNSLEAIMVDNVECYRVFLLNDTYQFGTQPYHKMSWDDLTKDAKNIVYQKNIIGLEAIFFLYRIYFTLDYYELWATKKFIENEE